MFQEHENFLIKDIVDIYIYCVVCLKSIDYFAGVRDGDANLFEDSQQEYTSADAFEEAMAEKMGSIRSFITTPSRWLPGIMALSSYIKQYLKEANQMRKELSFPARTQVLKLTIISLIGTAIMMGVVGLIDFVLLKVLAEPYLRRMQTVAIK